MKKIISNMDVVTDFMEYGSPLNQAFLMEAVRRYASATITNEARIRKDWTDHSFVTFDAWLECAKEWMRLHDAQIANNSPS